MKAIILAAGIGKRLGNISLVPKCLIEIGEKTLLERQIDILTSCGISKEDILVVIGEEGEAWSEENRQKVKNLHKNVLINTKNLETGNSHSLWLALRGINENVIFLDGDLFFSKEAINKLLNSSHSSALLTTNEKTPQRGNLVLVKGDRVLGIGPNFETDRVYTGIAKFGRDFLQKFKEEMESKDYSKTNLDVPIYQICFNNFIHNVDLYDFKIKDSFLNGGSFAVTKILEKKEGQSEKNLKFVRKEATEDKEKLINEAKWLINLPKDLKNHFPEVLNYNLEGDHVYMDLKYYPYKSLRRSLMSGEIDKTKAKEILSKVFDFLFEKLYTKEIKNYEKDFVNKVYFDRIFDRLELSKKKSNIFREIIDKKTLKINGKEFSNIKPLISSLKSEKDLLDALNPTRLSLLHGDLHFDNVLIDKENPEKFILIDPRGKMYGGGVGGDYTYDLGKVYHCLNGLYDFIHENKFDLSINNDLDDLNANFKIQRSVELDQYKGVLSGLPTLFNKYDLLKEDKNWKIRASFSEVAHFCSMAPFHIKGAGDEKIALGIYLRGVMLLNQFAESWQKDNFKFRLININTQKDYEEASNFAKEND